MADASELFGLAGILCVSVSGLYTRDAKSSNVLLSLCRDAIVSSDRLRSS